MTYIASVAGERLYTCGSHLAKFFRSRIEDSGLAKLSRWRPLFLFAFRVESPNCVTKEVSDAPVISRQIL